MTSGCRQKMCAAVPEFREAPSTSIHMPCLCTRLDQVAGGRHAWPPPVSGVHPAQTAHQAWRHEQRRLVGCLVALEMPTGVHCFGCTLARPTWFECERVRLARQHTVIACRRSVLT